MYLLVEQVLGCSQMPVDCLRALKLVTLGYNYLTIDCWYSIKHISNKTPRISKLVL